MNAIASSTSESAAIANQSRFAFIYLTNPGLNWAVDQVKIHDHALGHSYYLDIIARLPQHLLTTKLIGQQARFDFLGSTIRPLNNFFGWIKRASYLGRVPDRSAYVYRLRMESPLAPLHLSNHYRTWVNRNLQDVINEILNTYDISYKIQWRLQQSYHPQSFWVQHGETDFAYFHFLLATFGLFYTFLQTTEGWQLIITDTVALLNNDVYSLSYVPLSGHFRPETSIIMAQQKQKNLPNSVTVNNYSPDIPDQDLSATVTTQMNVASLGCDQRYGESVNSLAESKRRAQLQLEALDTQRQQFLFVSDDPALQVGQCIQVINMPFSKINTPLRVIAISHLGDQSSGKIYSAKDPFKDFNFALDHTHSEFTSSHEKFAQDNLLPLEKVALTYYNIFTAIPSPQPFRLAAPALQYQRAGLGIAYVESPDENGVYIDDQGRYHLRFAFDVNSTAPSGHASSPIRSIQPHAGPNQGMYFPLPHNTPIVYIAMMSDPARPLILGAIPTPQHPTPVTAANATSHVLRTRFGHSWTIQDTPETSQQQFATPQGLNSLTLQATLEKSGIHLASQQGEMNWFAQQTFTAKSNGNIQQTSGGSHHVTVNQNHSVRIQQGSLQFQSGRDILLNAKQDLQMTSQQRNINLSSGADTIFNIAQDATFIAQQGDISWQSVAGDLAFQAKKNVLLTAAGKGPIILENNGARITIHPDGRIQMQANKITIKAQQHNLMGTTSKLGGEGRAPQTSPANNPGQVKLDYFWVDGSEAGKPIVAASAILLNPDSDNPFTTAPSNQQGKVQVVGLNSGSATLQQASAPDPSSSLDPDEAIRWLLAIVKVNNKNQSPWQTIQLKVTTDASAPSTQLHALFPPIIKDYTAIGNGEQGAKIPVLSNEEIQYFKTNGNNATIFIHGYNVAPGNFAKEITAATTRPCLVTDSDGMITTGTDLELTTSNNANTVLRNLTNLHEQFPNIPAKIDAINDALLIDPITQRVDDYDEMLNGTQAHNWLLHIEHNLNCAAAGASVNNNSDLIFPWENYVDKFTRIIGVLWPGKEGETNFADAELPAAHSGQALVALIKQLHQANISINIIAHSLGNKLLLNAMQLLAEKEQLTNCINHAFLWEAAVPNVALSTMYEYDLTLNTFPRAYEAANKITILYSDADEVLEFAYPAGTTQIEVEDVNQDMNSYAYLHRDLLSLPALGRSGPRRKLEDPIMEKWINEDKIFVIDQSKWLLSHSGMKIPSEDLFRHVYSDRIIQAKGMKFGKYKGIGQGKD